MLARSRGTAGHLDAVEPAETSAAHCLARVHDLGLDPASVNADGGAIVLGGPFACSGTRLAVTLMLLLERV
ncbi:MAG: hypothetical protein HOV94_27750 [Saccharothrix sp.]|nr:hypothetical protein [Saccharothrix sp.]